MSPRPSAGISTSGTSEVAGIGIASVDHQVAISRASPAQAQALSLMPPGGGSVSVISSHSGPSISPMRAAVVG